MDSHAERRQYARVSANAYSCGKICALDFGEVRPQAELVDISAGGARLRLQAELPKQAGAELTLSVSTVDDKGLLQNLQAKICWHSGQDVGVKFMSELKVGLSDLQRMVC